MKAQVGEWRRATITSASSKQTEEANKAAEEAAAATERAADEVAAADANAEEGKKAVAKLIAWCTEEAVATTANASDSPPRTALRRRPAIAAVLKKARNHPRRRPEIAAVLQKTRSHLPQGSESSSPERYRPPVSEQLMCGDSDEKWEEYRTQFAFRLLASVSTKMSTEIDAFAAEKQIDKYASDLLKQLDGEQAQDIMGRALCPKSAKPLRIHHPSSKIKTA